MLPSTHRWVLPNGLTVILREDFDAGLVSTQIWVKAGSIHEGEHLGSGLSHALEHMLFKGTQTRKGSEIDEQIEALGGQHNAYTTFDRTVYHIDGPAEHTDLFLELLSDMVLHAKLEAEDFISEKEVILREMAMYLDEPWDYLSSVAMAAQFKSLPYRYPIIGYATLFSALTREDLLAYYKKQYVPGNMIVVVAGAVQRKQLEAIVNVCFQDVLASTVPALPLPFEVPSFQPRALRLKGPFTRGYGSMQFSVPCPQGYPLPEITALNRILGGGETSLLWKSLFEDKGCVSSIESSLSKLGEQGLLIISYECDCDAVETVEAAVWEVVNILIKKGFTATLLEQVKRQARVSEVNRLKTVSGQAAVLGFGEATYGDPLYSTHFIEELLAVQPSQVQAAAALYLRPSNALKVTLQAGGEKIDLQHEPVNLPITLEPCSEKIDDLIAAFTPIKKDDRQRTVMASQSPSDTGATPVRPFSEGALGEAKVYWQARAQLPKVYIKLLFQGGPWLETPEKRGETYLLSTFLRRSRPHIAEQIEALGGYLSDKVSNLMMSFSSEVLAEDFDQAIALLAEVLTFPTALTDGGLSVFKREQAAQLSDIESGLDDAQTQSFWALRRLFFKNNPLADPAIGRLDSVEALTLADIQALYHHLVRQGNLRIVVSGDFNENTLLNQLAPLIAVLPLGSATPIHPVFEVPEAVTQIKALPDREQAILYEAYHIPGEAVEGNTHYVLQVLCQMLSSMSGLLFANVRNQGLGYYAAAAVLGGWNDSAWLLYSGTEPGKETAVFAAFDKVLAQLRAGTIQAAALARAQQSVIVAQKMNLQSPSGRANSAIGSAFFGRGPNDWMDYATKIRAVTVKDVQQLAQVFFKQEHRVRLIARSNTEENPG